MNNTRNSAARWAPWWAYGMPIGAANLLRQVLVPPAEVGDAVSIALFAVTAAVIAVTVTAVHRLRLNGARAR